MEGETKGSSEGQPYTNYSTYAYILFASLSFVCFYRLADQGKLLKRHDKYFISCIFQFFLSIYRALCSIICEEGSHLLESKLYCMVVYVVTATKQ